MLEMKSSNTNLVYIEKVDINEVGLIISFSNLIIQKLE